MTKGESSTDFQTASERARLWVAYLSNDDEYDPRPVLKEMAECPKFVRPNPRRYARRHGGEQQEAEE